MPKIDLRKGRKTGMMPDRIYHKSKSTYRLSRQDNPSIHKRNWSTNHLLLIYVVFVFVVVLLFSGIPARLVSIPLFVVSLWRLSLRPLSTAEAFALWVSAGIIAVPLLQLVPLPPEIWSRLPGRDFIAVADTVLGETPNWRPLSLRPAETLRSLLFMLPAFAIYCAALTLDARSRRFLALVIVILATLSVPLGLAQVAGGVDSALRPVLGRSHGNVPVGFFANRNHFAALLYAAIPLTVAGVVFALNGPARDERRMAGVVCGLVIIACLLLGIGMSASRSGIVLSIVALAGSALLIWRSPGTTKYAGRIVTVATVIGVFLVMEFGLTRLLSRAAQDPLTDARLQFLNVAKELSAAVSPAGTGMGAFANSYAMFETLTTSFPFFVDYLHNDWMQLWIEGGIFAGIVVAAFSIWFGWRCIRIWVSGGELSSEGNASDPHDLSLARAATISILLLLLHAIVEYHLRSSGIECTFAILLALVSSAPTAHEYAQRPTPPPR